MSTGTEDVIGAITEALAFEKGMRDFYSYVASRAKGTLPKEMFEALRDMEDRHMRYLDFLYRSVSEGRDLMGYRDFSSKIAATHVGSGLSGVKAAKLFDEREVTSNKEALAHARSIEDRAHDLYRQLAGKAGDGGVRAVFEEMMAQETKHIEYLKDLERSL